MLLIHPERDLGERGIVIWSYKHFAFLSLVFIDEDNNRDKLRSKVY